MTRLRRALRRDEGTSLVELLVATVLTALLGAALVTTLLQGMRTTQLSDSRTANGQAVRTVLEAMTQALRTAADPSTAPGVDAFVAAGPTDVTFYAALGNRTGAIGADVPPSRVRFWFAPTGSGLGEVRQTVVPPDPGSTLTAATWSGAGTTRVLARSVVAPTAGCPLFVYQRRSDAPTAPCPATRLAVDTSTSTVPVAADGSVAAANLSRITAVEVWVTVRTDSLGGSDPSSPRRATSTGVDRVTLLNENLTT
ncbi:PulJ/GspJ family protein [Vallicoccus soli]|uniref:Prepilin-type N-terminal cleavage/methylation domain-containing protein n=1 Tax=Vallicoccus soli TaxID=2339232 RepID=A0A3A3Z0R0_9ACTN|nr:hypothetical protein [Vallicoccus soli]RJK96773.1 hypothetical protein D5H78_05735 [Vallicoccus soli]